MPASYLGKENVSMLIMYQPNK